MWICFGGVHVGTRNRCHLTNWRFNLETVPFWAQTGFVGRLLIYHAERILVSTYYKKTVIGSVWPVSPEDFFFCERIGK